MRGKAKGDSERVNTGQQPRRNLFLAIAVVSRDCRLPCDFSPDFFRLHLSHKMSTWYIYHLFTALTPGHSLPTVENVNQPYMDSRTAPAIA